MYAARGNGIADMHLDHGRRWHSCFVFRFGAEVRAFHLLRTDSRADGLTDGRIVLKF